VTIFAGQYWYFYVNSNGGVIPHKYQWYEGNTLLPGQTDMVIKATQSTPGVYTYYCKVTDAIGNTANSSSVILTVK
jgi:plastocyanin